MEPVCLGADRRGGGGGDPETRLHVLIPSVTALIVGIQFLFSMAALALLVTQGNASPEPVGRESESASSRRNEAA